MSYPNTSIQDPGIDLATFDSAAEIQKFKDWGIEVQGTQLLIRLYIPPETHVNRNGEKTGLILPQSAREEFDHSARVGLVVAMGKDAYNERFKTGPYCKIGDWVFFPKHEGIKEQINGICCYLLEDRSVGMTLKNPLVVKQYRG
jgi:co-chaperonin GroES (HSP10)